ncbi:MAG: pyridoxal-phosphate-dependent aminotransferase family protein [Candidatus Bathyarchaeia archaeon]
MLDDETTILLTPGPITVHPRVARAMQRIVHHRSPEFRAMLSSCLSKLKEVMQTKNDVFILTGSGTSAMEASIANCISPGDEVLNILGGKFGDRWLRITKTFGGVPVEVPVEWGKAVDPKRVIEILDARPSIKFITLVHNETSTGVLQPAEEIGRIAREYEKILIVDGVTSVGGDYVYPDKWGFDLLVTGSQKCIGCPPGLAMIMVSERAWSTMEERKGTPTFYLDLQSYRKSAERGETPYTPAVSLVSALHESLTMILEEGLEKRVERHRLLARGTRAGYKGMGLKLFADERHLSNTVTAVRYPDGIDDDFIRLMKEYGILIAGGQDELKGKIFRIAHVNICEQRDILVTVGASEVALRKLGYDVNLGSGVKAAQEVFLKG